MQRCLVSQSATMEQRPLFMSSVRENPVLFMNSKQLQTRFYRQAQIDLIEYDIAINYS